MTDANFNTDKEMTKITIHRNDAFDNTDLAYECVGDLEPLFQAIYKESDKNSTIKGLAKVGVYLTQDWASLLSSQYEEMQAQDTEGNQNIESPLEQKLGVYKEA